MPGVVCTCSDCSLLHWTNNGGRSWQPGKIVSNNTRRSHEKRDARERVKSPSLPPLRLVHSKSPVAADLKVPARLEAQRKKDEAQMRTNELEKGLIRILSMNISELTCLYIQQ